MVRLKRQMQKQMNNLQKYTNAKGFMIILAGFGLYSLISKDYLMLSFLAFGMFYFYLLKEKYKKYMLEDD